MNGSNIQRWWTIHHFTSMFLTGLLLTLPNDAVYAAFRPLYSYFALYLSIVQLLQIRYQIARLYAIVSLALFLS